MLTVDDLVSKSKTELDELFRDGETPDGDAVEGTTRGRVLAGRGPLRLGAARELINTPLLPWKGKVFEAGGGRNRIEVGPIKRQEFAFDTYAAPPLHDGGDDVLVLDYDVPENPPGIRQVVDELREIDTGLYLGTSNIAVGDDGRFMFYFGLEEAAGDVDVELGDGEEITIE